MLENQRVSKKMIKKLIRTIKQHSIKLAVSLLLGAIVGAVATYFIEEQKVEFWKERFVESSELSNSLEKERNRLKQKNKELVKENSNLRNDLGITILSSVRSNYYNLKALKSEDYNKQMYFNEQEYRSNLVPRAMGEKYGINILKAKYNRELKQVVDSVYNARTSKK